MSLHTGRRGAVLASILLAASACKAPREQAEPPPAEEPRAEAKAEVAEQALSEEPAEIAGAALPQDEVADEPAEAWKIDTTHDAVSKQIASTASWLDSFFGDQRSRAEDNRTTVDVRLDTFTEKGEDVDFSIRPTIRLVLPSTENRLNLILSADAEDDPSLSNDLIDNISEEVAGTDEENGAAALQYFLKETDNTNLRSEAGVRFSGGTPNAFLGMRYRHTVPVGSWVFRNTDRVRWFTDNGFETLVVLDFERLLAESLFFRSSTRGDWFEDREGLFYAQRFGFYQTLDEKRVMVYDANATFQTYPTNRAREFRVRVRYRQQVGRPWIFVELLPQLRWPEDNDYDTTWGFLLRLEFFVGAAVE